VEGCGGAWRRRRVEAERGGGGEWRRSVEAAESGGAK